MKVEVLTYDPKTADLRDHCDGIEIHVNGKRVFGAYDGEPEDNNLCRNFNECYNIDTLMQMAYEAGRAGESFEIVSGELVDD